jgi:hypothetical protein
VIAGDTSGGLATYEHKYENHRAGRIDVGVTAFGAQAQLGAEISISGEVTLSLELRGGFDYDLHALETGDGILWRHTAAQQWESRPH